MIAGIGLLVAIDLFSVAGNYLNEDNYQEAVDYDALYQPRPVDEQILQDKSYYRVLDLSRDVYNDAVQAYFHKCIGGYSPAKMEIYQDMIDVHMSRKFNGEVLNMLNTKYIIFNGGPNNSPVAQKNDNANGNAWFVSQAKWAKTADEEILSLNADALGDTVKVENPFDSKNTVVIRESHKTEMGDYTFGKDSAASITLTKYGLNDMAYQSTNNQNGLGVFSEVYYDKGWEAYVDGKQTPIIRVNYLLRAIKIPAGQHKIEFHFRPKSFEIGSKISMISSLLIYGLAIAAIIMLLMGKKPNLPVDEK
jgi:hypothetical protein